MNNEACERLYETYYMRVFSYAMTLAGDRHLAEEITQETFLRAMKTAGQFHGNSSLYTWLCALAKNHWLNLYRTGKREAVLADSISTEECTAPSPEEAVIQKDTAMQIHMVLHNLQEP